METFCGVCAQASSILKDLQEMLYILGGSPRPVEASMVQLGPRNGRERLVNKALN